MSSRPALSTRAKSTWATKIFAGIFAVIAFVGGAFGFYVMTVRPVMSCIAARSWVSTPCTILTSAVKAHSGTNTTTYSVAISYSYTVNAKQYRSDRYNFATGSSSSRAWREAVVKAYPRGRVTTCFVNSLDPSQAVLNRNLHAEYLWGLLPLFFFAIGSVVVGGVTWYLVTGRSGDQMPGARGQETAWPQQNADPTPLAGFAAEVRGPITLKPEFSPRGELLGALLIALFWNGLVSIFVLDRLPRLLGPQLNWFDVISSIFLLPFIGAGIYLLGLLASRLLALFNPWPVLTLSQAQVPLGGRATLAWGFEGRWETLESLSIRLKGREVSKKTQRKSNRKRRIFYDQLLFERSRPDAFAEGEIKLALPADTMHSFKSEHNSIDWQLSLVGRVPWWPGVKADFPLSVAPHE